MGAFFKRHFDSSNDLYAFTPLELMLTDGVRYWVSSRTQTPGSRRYNRGATASSLSIEMTAYVLLTYINVYGHDAIARGSAISKWIVSQQGPNGGFKSSQVTF